MGKLLRVHRVAEILDCCKSQIYRMVQRNELTAIRLGPRGIRITAKSLEDYLSLNQVDTNE
jgi:excisionase family DNA binding protein